MSTIKIDPDKAVELRDSLEEYTSMDPLVGEYLSFALSKEYSPEVSEESLPKTSEEIKRHNLALLESRGNRALFVRKEDGLLVDFIPSPENNSYTGFDYDFDDFDYFDYKGKGNTTYLIADFRKEDLTDKAKRNITSLTRPCFKIENDKDLAYKTILLINDIDKIVKIYPNINMEDLRKIRPDVAGLMFRNAEYLDKLSIFLKPTLENIQKQNPDFIKILIENISKLERCKEVFPDMSLEDMKAMPKDTLQVLLQSSYSLETFRKAFPDISLEDIKIMSKGTLENLFRRIY